MGKTIYDVWLDTNPPLSSQPSSKIIKNHLPPQYYEDDSETTSAVEKMTFWSDLESIESSFSLYTLSISRILKAKKFYKEAVLNIINDCIHQLSILIGLDRSSLGNNLTRIIKYKTVKQRYGGACFEYDSHVIGEMHADVQKMQRDFGKIVTVLKSFWDEFDIFSDMTCLVEFISATKMMKDDEARLMEECEEKKALFLNMMKELKFAKTNTMKRLQDEEAKADELRTHLRNLSAYSSAETDYVAKWEVARYEQNRMVLEAQENSYQLKVNETKRKCLSEDTCHENIQKFYTEHENDQLDEIQRWINEYARAVERKDLDILHKKHVTANLIEKREALQTQYDARAKEIEDWLTCKRIKREREERMELERTAATRIQAWWRGTMVRKRLGPFKPKKKGKKGDKKGKKGTKRQSKK